jgi:hypothetical protein
VSKTKESGVKPVIALLTDFGSRDWFAASMKGVIKRIAPKADIVDITHNVEPHNIASASFILGRCYRDFPEGTVFCCVVDPGVGTSRKRLAASNGMYYFVAPDNGLLSSVESCSEGFLCWFLENPKYRNQGPGTTFEGRDVFAPAAAHLASGVDIEEFGPHCRDMVRLGLFETCGIKNGVLEGRILYVDRFGNLITNITPEDLEKDWDESRLIVHIKRKKIHGLFKGYEDVKPGALLAYWGSTGCLEVGINQGKASEVLGILVGEPFSITT